MASIYKGGQKEFEELKRKSTILDGKQKELVLLIEKGEFSSIITIRPEELLAAVLKWTSYDINDIRLPAEIVEDFKDCQRRRKAGEGLHVPSLNAREIEVQR